MTAMRIAAGIVLLVLMSGCVKRGWAKPGSTRQEFAEQRYDCRRQSKDGFLYDKQGNTKMVRDDRMFFECMEAHGWSLEERR